MRRTPSNRPPGISISMGVTSIIIFVLASIWTSLCAQTPLNWEGPGKGFQYLKIQDNKGILELSDWSAPHFTLMKNQQDTIHCLLDDRLDPHFGDSTFRIIALNDKLDSLYTDLHGGYTFYKKEVSPYHSRFSFERVTYEQWDSWGKQHLKIELNASGIYTYQERANSPIRQIQISSELVDTFKALLKEIQIESMESTVAPSICDNINHTFTFVSCYRDFYTYSSWIANRQIKPIQEFLLRFTP